MLDINQPSITKARRAAKEVLEDCVVIIDNQFGESYAKRNPQVLTTLITFYQEVLKKPSVK